MASFGEFLGAEILEAREAEHQTQLALAEEVFDDENYVRRIGDYETGKVKRPRAKVYQPLCDVLGITRQRIGELKAQAADTKTVTDDEMAALRAEKGSLEQALSDLQTLSRAQLETLASRFELDKPYQATDGALVEFLANKAQDYRALQAEVDAIEDGLKRLSNLEIRRTGRDRGGRSGRGRGPPLPRDGCGTRRECQNRRTARQQRPAARQDRFSFPHPFCRCRQFRRS